MFVRVLCSFSFDILLIKSLKQLCPVSDQQIPQYAKHYFQVSLSIDWVSRTHIALIKSNKIQSTSIEDSFVCQNDTRAGQAVEIFLKVAFLKVLIHLTAL